LRPRSPQLSPAVLFCSPGFHPVQWVHPVVVRSTIDVDTWPPSRPAASCRRNRFCATPAVTGLAARVAPPPYESSANAVGFMDFALLPETDRARILRGNAERILRLQ
jgi:hypothetical protein